MIEEIKCFCKFFFAQFIVQLQQRSKKFSVLDFAIVVLVETRNNVLNIFDILLLMSTHLIYPYALNLDYP